MLILDLRALSSLTEFFVIGTGGSSRQIEALAEHIEAALARGGCAVRHIEGTASPPSGESARGLALPLQWVLMDCGDIVVHLLDQPTRAFYRLEDLWADAPRVAVTPNLPTLRDRQ